MADSPFKYRPSATWQLFCAGSTQASSGLPRAPSSDAAERGTAIHAAVEAAMLIGATATAMMESRWLDDAEACAIAEQALKALMSIADECDDWTVERAVDIGAVLGSGYAGKIGGTADFVGYDRRTHTAHIGDIKTGSNFVPPSSPQLRSYAVGVTGIYPDAQQVRVHVIQPQCPDHAGNIVHSETLVPTELGAMVKYLRDAIDAAEEPNPPRSPGSWCRYCPALANCKPAAEYFIGPTTAALNQNMGPDDLAPAEITRIVMNAGVIREFVSAVCARATERLKNGETLPQLKLIKRGVPRRWDDEAALLADLAAAGADLDKVAPRKLAKAAELKRQGFDDIAKRHLGKPVSVYAAVHRDERGKPVDPPVTRNPWGGFTPDDFNL